MMNLEPVACAEDRRQEIAHLVHGAIVSILPGLRTGEISGDCHLEDLGADSVDRVEILLSILHRLHLKEPLASFAPLKDIDALVDFLWRRELP